MAEVIQMACGASASYLKRPTMLGVIHILIGGQIAGQPHKFGRWIRFRMMRGVA
jgi:hypothetical protein